MSGDFDAEVLRRVNDRCVDLRICKILVAYDGGTLIIWIMDHFTTCFGN